MIHGAGIVLVEDERYAIRLAEAAIGEADTVGLDILGCGGLVRIVHCDSRYYSDHIGHNGEARFRAVDVVLHRGCLTHPDRSDSFSLHPDGKPAAIRRHTRERRDACQKRWIALDKAEKILWKRRIEL